MSTIEDKVNTWLQGTIGPSHFDKSAKKDPHANITTKASNENIQKEGAMRAVEGKESSARR